MTDQQPTELTKPSVGAFDDPSALVSPELPAVFVAPELAVFAVRDDEVNAAFAEPFAQGVGIVGPVGDYPLRLLSGAALGAWDFDFGERGFRKHSFARRGAFQPNSQRKTLTVDQYHPLRALATLGFSNRRAPFLAGAKLPSKKLSSHFSRPLPSSTPSSARQASSHTSCSSHCRNRRQHVAGEGYLSGRNRQAAPVCRTHKMPSKHARLETHGRPRLSLRRFGSGNSGSTNAHCASVNNSNRFLPIQEAQQINHLMQKYQA